VVEGKRETRAIYASCVGEQQHAGKVVRLIFNVPIDASATLCAEWRRGNVRQKRVREFMSDRIVDAAIRMSIVVDDDAPRANKER